MRRKGAVPRAILVAALALSSPGASPAVAQPPVQWRELRVPSRCAQAMVRDSRRDRAIMLGGDGRTGQPFAGVWQLVSGAGMRWEPLATIGGGPSPRSGHCAVYDSLRDRVLVFGGRAEYGDTGSNELWALSLSATPQWTLLDVSAGPSPPGRSHASMILDARDRLVLYGGEGVASFDSSVWVLPLATQPLAWSGVPLPGPGPGPRARHGAAYSPGTDRMSVFGGDRRIVDTRGVADYVLRPAVTWELVLEPPIHWVQRASAPSDSVPLPESGGPLVADRSGEVAWLFPGDQGYDAEDASVWRLDLLHATWTRVQSGPGGPGLRALAAACLAGAGEVLVHGGGSDLLFGVSEPSTGTWRFEDGAPTPWSVAVPIPTQESAPTRDRRVHFDLPTRRLITWTSEGVWTNDVSLDGAWRLDPAGAVNAPPHFDPVSVLDPPRRRLLVFGGRDAARRSVVPDRLWAWPLDGPGAWTTAAIDGPAPLATWGIQSAYDPARDRVIVLPSASNFESPGLARLDTVTVLELAGPSPRWVRLATSGGPPLSRSDAPVILDRARDRLILQGGVFPDFDGFHCRDLWTMSLSERRWTNDIPYSLDFGIVTRQGLLLDPTSDRLLLIGGASQSIMDLGDRNTLYAAPLDGLPGWSDLDPDGLSPMYGGGVAVLDAAGQRALFWNGTLWEITWPFGPVDAPPGGPARPGLAWSPPRPNPATDQVTLELASGAETEVTVEVFDASGRRVAPVLRRRIVAGRTAFTVPLARALTPGLYLVRASDGVYTAQAKLAITR